MKTEDGEIVPGPVWNAEFIVTDENDNPPSIQESSKLHAMEESIRKGDSLPEKSFMNNPSNGYIKIVDPDDQDSDSMRLVSRIFTIQLNLFLAFALISSTLSCSIRTTRSTSHL